MKKTSIKIITSAILLLALECSGYSQGFVNLDFESAKIIPIVGDPNYPYAVEITNGVPGWAVFGTTNGSMLYNLGSIGTTFAILLATNGAISGHYSFQLEGMLSFYPATISQTGLVPVGSQTLLFEAQSFAGSTSLIVSLGGQVLSVSAIGTGPDYTLYGADISTFAGQVEQLNFSAPSTGQNIWTIDNIQFSSSPVPEPGALSLLAMAGALLGLRSCRRHF